jgi:hypothetical protein
VPIAWTALEARARELEAQHGLEFSRFVQSLKKMNPHDAQYLYP